LFELKKLNPKYVSFFDDDCTVDKFWLINVLKVIAYKKADIVTGPQIYPKEINSKKINYAIFFEKKVKGNISKVNWAASNNVFFKYKVISKQNISFDIKLNKFGIGEDQLFFSILNQKGFKIYWSKNIKVYEKIHNHRLNIKWLVSRSYRLGVLGHYIDVKLYGVIFGYLINYLKSLLYLFFSISNIFCFFDKEFKIHFLNMIARFYGRLVGPFKINKIQFYKK
jgi:GT2 family glycosyltransferase